MYASLCRKSLVVICILGFVSLACISDFLDNLADIPPDSGPSFNDSELATMTQKALLTHMAPTETPLPTLRRITQAIRDTPAPKPKTQSTTDTPPEKPKSCYWMVLDESDPLPSGMVNEHMEVTPIRHGVSTSFKHGISGCIPQYFVTYHRWIVPGILYPNQSEVLKVQFEWSLLGTTECTTLVAGGTTSLNLGDVRIKAESLSFNLKNHPHGEAWDYVEWTVPAGEEGEKFTMTLHAATGSFGKNIRWHYEYICDG
jgi:hypothetical protein